jgi:hypothetical protein
MLHLGTPARDQLVLPGGRDQAGAFPPRPSDFLVNPFAPARAARLTIQAVIHAAFVQVKDWLAGQLCQFASEEPPLHLVAFALFGGFF